MNYQFNSYVNRQEADALKEMIFNRVRERSQAMTENVQADVMELARESFAANNHNPFASMITSQETAQTSQTPAVQEPVKEEKIEEVTPFTKTENPTSNENKQNKIGFPQKNLFSATQTQNRLIKEQMTAIEIQNNMMEAREALSNKKSFMGALAFLNSQAAVSLLRTRTDKFEVIG